MSTTAELPPVRTVMTALCILAPLVTSYPTVDVIAVTVRYLGSMGRRDDRVRRGAGLAMMTGKPLPSLTRPTRFGTSPEIPGTSTQRNACGNRTQAARDQ